MFKVCGEFTHKEIKSKIVLLKDNEIYRVNDCINGVRVISKEILGNPDKYKGSILYDYLQTKTHKNKYADLKQIIMKHIDKKKYQIPDDDMLVVHVRAGDAYNMFGLGHAKTRADLMKSIANLHSKCKKIVVVTGLHYGVNTNSTNYAKAHKYVYKEANHNQNINCFFDFFTELKKKYPDKELYIYSNDNIDSDLAFLSNAKHLCVTTGGFSRLVMKLRTISPSKTIPFKGTTQPPPPTPKVTPKTPKKQSVITPASPTCTIMEKGPEVPKKKIQFRRA